MTDSIVRTHKGRVTYNPETAGGQPDQPVAEFSQTAPETLTLDELRALRASEDRPPCPSDRAGLGAENETLRKLVVALRAELQALQQKMAGARQAREQEYQRLIEEKTEVIRQLDAQLQEQQAASASPGLTAAELANLRDELDLQRQQLQQDEELLMAQIRQMEVQMSRERAELARQRHELQRLHDSFKQELEAASRDAELRQKLAPLYRLQDQMLGRPADPRPQAAETPPPADPLITPGNRRSGFLRRLFGRQ